MVLTRPYIFKYRSKPPHGTLISLNRPQSNYIKFTNMIAKKEYY